MYGDNTLVVYFPVEQKSFDRAKRDVSIWEQVENIAQMQYYWADNQVSATVTFGPEEAKDIPRILELYESRLKSVSFLPLQDHNYPQAPYQEMPGEAYFQAVAHLKPLNFRALNTDEAQDMFCDGETCVVERPERFPEPQEFEFVKEVETKVTQTPTGS